MVSSGPEDTPRTTFLSRLLGRRDGSGRPSPGVTKTTRTDRLNLTVPSSHAEAVRAAVERWLFSHGITASVAIEDAGDGKSKLSAKFSDDDRRLDLTDDAVQADLQAVLRAAIEGSA